MTVAAEAMCMCMFSPSSLTDGQMVEEEENIKSEKLEGKLHRILVFNNTEKVLLQADPSMLGYGHLRS